MKKLLGILAVLGFSVTTTASVVACGCKLKEENQKVVDKIIKADNVESEITIDTPANSLVQKYDGEFIANFLDSETKEIFQVEDFETLKVTKENGDEIFDADLAKPNEELKAKLNFNYGFVENQILDLKIKVKEDELIAQEISAASYSLKPESFKATPDDVIKQINGETFIPDPKKIKHAGFFDVDKYETKSVKVGDHVLGLKDLKTSKPFSAKIIFDYGDKKNQETNLTIQGVFQSIEADLALDKIYVGQSTKLTIKNYEALKESNLTINPDEKVQVVDHKDGTATVTPIDVGTSTITINADNAEKVVTLTLEIIPKITIKADLEKSKIHIGETTKIIIDNYNDLKENNLTINPDEKVQVEDRGDGTVTVTPIDVGTSTITINADNAKEPVFLTLEITPPLPIEAQGTNVSLELTQTHLNETLTEVDQIRVHDEMIAKLKEANKDAVIENDTFDFDLAKVISKIDEISISVDVKGTDSTPKKPGLKEGKVDVTLNLSPLAWDIADLLKGQTELGYFADGNAAKNKATEIINSNSQLNGHVILGIPEDGTIRVDPKDKSVKGYAKFTYQVQSNIADLLKGQTELGYFADGNAAKNKATEIINSIPQLKGHVKLVGDPENGIITVKPGDNTLQGSAQFTYKVQSNIADLLKGQTELGYFASDDAAKSKATDIINLIPQLSGHVKLGNPSNGKITVEPLDNSVQGKAEFTYQVQSDIAELLKGRTELGYVNKNEYALEIAQTIILELKLQWHVALGEPENGIITVKPGDDTLQGYTEFTFNLTDDIEKIIPEKKLDLGYVESEDAAIEKMQNVLAEVKLTNKVTWSLDQIKKTIKVISIDKNLFGAVEFRYQLK